VTDDFVDDAQENILAIETRCLPLGEKDKEEGNTLVIDNRDVNQPCTRCIVNDK
jgi:hypothetical protein